MLNFFERSQGIIESTLMRIRVVFERVTLLCVFEFVNLKPSLLYIKNKKIKSISFIYFNTFSIMDKDVSVFLK